MLITQKVKKWKIHWYSAMSKFNDINKIIEDYPFDEDDPFLMETPSEVKVYTKEDLVNDEDE